MRLTANITPEVCTSTTIYWLLISSAPDVVSFRESALRCRNFGSSAFGSILQTQNLALHKTTLAAKSATAWANFTPCFEDQCSRAILSLIVLRSEKVE